jgi:hypothetical protein
VGPWRHVCELPNGGHVAGFADSGGSLLVMNRAAAADVTFIAEKHHLSPVLSTLGKRHKEVLCLSATGHALALQVRMACSLPASFGRSLTCYSAQCSVRILLCQCTRMALQRRRHVPGTHTQPDACPFRRLNGRCRHLLSNTRRPGTAHHRSGSCSRLRQSTHIVAAARRRYRAFLVIHCTAAARKFSFAIARNTSISSS